jgi:hypothetical protein
LFGDLLGIVARPLDATLHGVLTTLGLHLGEADVRVHGIHCGGGVLAGQVRKLDGLRFRPAISLAWRGRGK